MLMMAIVEDEIIDAEHLRGCIEAYCSDRGIPGSVQMFDDGLAFLRSTQPFDIVFLDIRMSTMDGMETARLLRRFNADTILIFVTRMAQYAVNGYDFDAMDFLLKPVAQAGIDFVMDKAVRRISAGSGVRLTLRLPDGDKVISSTEIRYVEVDSREVIYHTESGDYRLRGQLSDVKRALEGLPFVACSRSHLVNLRYVTGIRDDTLLLGGVQIHISRSCRKDVEKRFINYLGEHI